MIKRLNSFSASSSLLFKSLSAKGYHFRRANVLSSSLGWESCLYDRRVSGARWIPIKVMRFEGNTAKAGPAGDWYNGM
jgi:hypothetical protein